MIEKNDHLAAVLLSLIICCAGGDVLGSDVHVWEKQEITLQARNRYDNPYKDVDVWIQLDGPGFNKKVNGFWDGDQTFRLRFAPTAPGQWTWKTESNQDDSGLNGITGKLTAVEWTDEEKRQNPCRRGFLRHMPNHRAFQYADGTPYFMIGDTLWTLGTFRYSWQPELAGIGNYRLGFQDVVQLRKSQGFNSVLLIACLPSWKNDGQGEHVAFPDGTFLRQPWPNFGINMHDENGRRPFHFPGPVPGYEDVFPDMWRINPAYFQSLDRKIDYLNEQGMIPFIEPTRRDITKAIRKHFGWPEPYSRLVQYVWARYQAHNAMLSPVHYDWRGGSVAPDEYNQAANQVIEQGGNPFDLPVSANPMKTTRQSFGDVDKARWMSFDMAGNDKARTHGHYETFVTTDYRMDPPLPIVNGEPYYAGWAKMQNDWDVPYGSETDDRYCRSAMYGNVLSGAMAGHVYGAQGAWGGWFEADAEPKAWHALMWESANQMKHLRAFMTSDDIPYWDLEPMAELLEPHKSKPDTQSFESWAYCARSPDQKFFLVYFEKDCQRARLAGALSNASYRAEWFDPRTGKWLDADEDGKVEADAQGVIQLPAFPDGMEINELDWAMRLRATNAARESD